MPAMFSAVAVAPGMSGVRIQSAGPDPAGRGDKIAHQQQVLQDQPVIVPGKRPMAGRVQRLEVVQDQVGVR